jgi:hypothetical protein
MRDKTKLTIQILEKLPPSLQLPLMKAMTAWWFNIRSSGGLRLTEEGFNIFTDRLDVKSHKISYDIKQDGHMKMMLLLDQKLTCPYYIEKKKYIHMFGEKEAMLAVLYSDLENFIKHYG